MHKRSKDALPIMIKFYDYVTIRLEVLEKLEAVCYNAVESHSNLNLYLKKLLYPSTDRDV